MPIEVKMFFPRVIDYVTNTSAKHRKMKNKNINNKILESSRENSQ